MIGEVKLLALLEGLELKIGLQRVTDGSDQLPDFLEWGLSCEKDHK